MLKRRTLLAASAGFTGALAAPSLAGAQAAWPTKSVRFIVPFAPGGGTDTVSRLVCDQLSRLLGQTFVVENKGGAGGNIGTTELARAAPDGYTVGLISVASHTLNPMLYSKLPYNADKDIVGISRLAVLANLLGVTPSLPANNVAELIALCKASPGKYAFASSGPARSGCFRFRRGAFAMAGRCTFDRVKGWALRLSFCPTLPHRQHLGGPLADDLGQPFGPQIERRAFLLVVGILAVDRERDARSCRAAMVGDVPQNDRRHPEPRHAGERGAPQIVRRPRRDPEPASRPFLGCLVGA
jgi:hypothetical protein